MHDSSAIKPESEKSSDGQFCPDNIGHMIELIEITEEMVHIDVRNESLRQKRVLFMIRSILHDKRSAGRNWDRCE
jgi:hypothetical protein